MTEHMAMAAAQAADLTDPVAESTGVIGDDIITTPALAAPVSAPDAHTAIIDSVTSRTFDSGATAIKVLAKSDQTGADLTLDIFVPRGFVENIQINPSQLPEVEVDEDAGVPANKQQSSYRRNVRNDKGTASLQQLLAIAQGQGRTRATLGLPVPQSFEQLVDLLDSLLRDVQVVVLRRPDLRSADPAYYGQLRVSRFVGPEVIEQAKALKGYRRLWEQ